MATKRIVYFNCPFSCNKKFDREKLVRHVDEKHQDELPEGFSSLRYVFHYVNKKPMDYHGICTECKGPTEWDENVGRYKRQCGSKACHDSYVKKFEDNMVRKTGHKRVTDTQSGLEEMLKRRKISGVYTFQNGAKKEYVGSYEKKCLEFMDKVMNIDPDDIMSPGPTMEYILDGKRHYYITDFYYQPYNLIIEVKDGGDNPNKRNMPEYRKKQMAKEKFIIDNTDYNYIRLTNNDMAQLLTVMADLKMQLVDGSGDRVIHVNENGFRTDPYIIKMNMENYIHENMNVSRMRKITEKAIESVDPKYTKHLRIANNTEGYLLYSSSRKFIGLFNLETKENDEVWIQALEVAEEFRNMGYGKFILKEAEQYGATNLSVNKKNTIAFNMYKTNGWKVYDETESMYFMSKNSNIKEGAMDQIKKEARYEYSIPRQDPKYIDFVHTNNGETHAIIDIKGYGRSRFRSENIVFKGNQIFAQIKDGVLKLPGGSLSRGETSLDAAIRETAEEALIKSINCTYIDNYIMMLNKPKQWILENVPKEKQWKNYYSEIFTSTYAGKVSRNTIAEIDRDDEFARKGGWHDITEVLQYANPIQEKAILSYMKANGIVESTINEGNILNTKDIYYNKDKFDNGEINICFITGLSGSGKSTLANDMEKNGVEKYELDDVLANYAFSDKNLKEYGDLIYSFFMGKGKQYRMTEQPTEENNWLNDKYDDDFEKELIRDFVTYSINYAKSHSKSKFVIEGVELYWFFKPEELKDYAVYIKGTSAVISMIRSASRDSKDVEGLKRIPAFLKHLFRKDRTHAYFDTEKIIEEWRTYFTTIVKEGYKIVYGGIVEDFTITRGPIDEGVVHNNDDIYHNKDKFDSGKINLCFITGLSGSGKSTMAGDITGNTEICGLDDIFVNYEYSNNDLKNYGSLVSSFFNGPGKQYRMTELPSRENNWLDGRYNSTFQRNMCRDLVDYAIDYAKSHFNKKFILEGVQLFWFFEPEELEKYAVYIKGTSVLLSSIRAAKRNIKHIDERAKRIPLFLKFVLDKDNKNAYLTAEKLVKKWRNYYSEDAVATESTVITEASTSKFEVDKIIINADRLKKEEKSFVSKDGFTNYIVKIRGYKKWLRGRSEIILFKDDCILLCLDLDGKGYTVPGGGWEPNESHAEAARRECNEEVGYETTIPKYISTYAVPFPPQPWVIKAIDAQYWWYGEYIELYCADYNGIYHQLVKKADQDPKMKRSAKWYNINLIWNMLIPPHKTAILQYLKKQNNPFGQNFAI